MDLDDDLDALLDEVESQFGCNAPSKNTSVCDSTASNVNRETVDTQGHHRLSQDVEALLLELQPDHEILPVLVTNEAGGAMMERKATAMKKCCPVFIGGTAIRYGLGTSTSQRSCDQLRCTSCDFRVLMFDDCAWDSCDYLFLRNNVPDHEKLCARLKKRRGVRAYACQCNWISSEEVRDLQGLPGLHWVCGQHPT
ncbi:cilia- and flagella-associated protein 418 [Synchiropus splendidus]|uniref:cilia- and flagella-associated protein 418 n=1 Tax=Synchiropus splendidus TaxID=270530 RepID=UPI00237DC73D|nr:cilia- and flagella-associated protein 418 [Synchiropus splendidus]